jgi:hypothetical protein
MHLRGIISKAISAKTKIYSERTKISGQPHLLYCISALGEGGVVKLFKTENKNRQHRTVYCTSCAAMSNVHLFSILTFDIA